MKIRIVIFVLLFFFVYSLPVLAGCGGSPPSSTYTKKGCGGQYGYFYCYEAGTATYRDNECSFRDMGGSSGGSSTCGANVVNYENCVAGDDGCHIGLAYGTVTCCSPSRGSSGICGSSNGGNYCSSGDVNDKCDRGSASWTDSTASDDVFNWRCNGTNGSCGGSDGPDVSCSANHLPDINGVCGSAKGDYLTSAPTTNLCTTGTASSVTFHPTATTPTPTPAPSYVGVAYVNKSTCSDIGGFCGDFSSTPPTGATCKVTNSINYGLIYTDLCGGDTTVKCCSPQGLPSSPPLPHFSRKQLFLDLYWSMQW